MVSCSAVADAAVVGSSAIDVESSCSSESMASGRAGSTSSDSVGAATIAVALPLLLKAGSPPAFSRRRFSTVVEQVTLKVKLIGVLYTAFMAINADAMMTFTEVTLQIRSSCKRLLILVQLGIRQIC